MADKKKQPKTKLVQPEAPHKKAHMAAASQHVADTLKIPLSKVKTHAFEIKPYKEDVDLQELAPTKLKKIVAHLRSQNKKKLKLKEDGEGGTPVVDAGGPTNNMGDGKIEKFDPLLGRMQKRKLAQRLRQMITWNPLKTDKK